MKKALVKIEEQYIISKSTIFDAESLNPMKSTVRKKL